MAELPNAHAIDALQAEINRAIVNFITTCSLSEPFKRSLVAGLLQNTLATMKLHERDKLSADEAMANLRERMRVACASFMLESPLSETKTRALLGGLLQSMLDKMGREDGD
jgi:hypothetical protein